MLVVIHVKVPRKIADFAAWSWCRGLGARGVAFKPFINHVLYFLILVAISFLPPYTPLPPYFSFYFIFYYIKIINMVLNERNIVRGVVVG